MGLCCRCAVQCSSCPCSVVCGLCNLLVRELVLATKEVRCKAVLWLCCLVQQWPLLQGLCKLLVEELVLAAAHLPPARPVKCSRSAARMLKHFPAFIATGQQEDAHSSIPAHRGHCT
jgi:hypothetical protein